MTDLKDRIVKLELVLKEKQGELDQLGSVKRKEEHAMAMMNEVEVQMKRMQEASEGYQEEERILHLQYEKQAEIALQNRCDELRVAREAPTSESYEENQELRKEIKELKRQNQGLQALVDEKENIISTMMAASNNKACTLHSNSGRTCKHCANGTHMVSARMREKLAFPFKNTCGGDESTKHKRVKKQLFTNPDVRFPTAAQKHREEIDAFVTNQKQQSFQIGEIERAVKILFSEIQERLGGGDIGPPVIVRLAVNVCKMVKEFRTNMTENEISLQQILHAAQQGKKK